MSRKEYEGLTKKSRFKIAMQKILCILAEFTIHPGTRIWIYKLMGIKIGRNVFVARNVYLDDQFPEMITIEDNVTIAVRVQIVAHDDSPPRTVEPVVIMKGAYIGMNASILLGVTIGENAIIGAGAVVTKDIPSNCTALGVPAKIVQ